MDLRRDAASEVPSVGKTEPTPSFRHLVQRRLFRAKARFCPTALIKKKRQRTSCPLLPICLKPISSVQPNASCDHSVKQEPTIIACKRTSIPNPWTLAWITFTRWHYGRGITLPARILVGRGQYTKHCIGCSWGLRAFLGGG